MKVVHGITALVALTLALALSACVTGGHLPVDQPEMVDIPPGSYLMGGSRPVTLRKRIAVSRTEITFAQWDACVAAGGCGFSPDDNGWGRGAHPLMAVNWNDAHQYVAWLRRATGKHYRLLTEAEWEYAARAGTTSSYYWGDNLDQVCKYASVVDGGDACGALRPVVVGTKLPNAWGLFDMSGSMWEWVEDCWADSLQDVPADGSAYLTGPCRWHVLRGGSWNFSPEYSRSDSRSYSETTVRADNYGIRVALDR